jgi:hypothetical protein
MGHTSVKKVALESLEEILKHVFLKLRLNPQHTEKEMRSL